MPMAAPVKKSVLFICLGNICRSTTAEAIMQHLVKQRGEASRWIIDSAAVADYNVGQPPDRRTMQVLEKNGITDYTHRARLITEEDFNEFDTIFAMDYGNMSDLEEMRPRGTCRARLQMLGEWDPLKETVIKDPYFLHGMKPFDQVFEQCLRCVSAFLDASSN